MDKIMTFMRNTFAPKVNRFVENAWVSGLQSSMLTGLPLVLVGSLITMISILNNYVTWMPDFSLMSTFSFGLFGLLVSFMIPYFVMEKKGYQDKRLIAGLTSIALYLLLMFPQFEGETVMFILSRFGSSGMFAAIISGLFVAAVMNFAASKSFFDEDSMIPDFVKGWFDSLLPITFILFIGWLLVAQFNVDFFEAINSLFSPLNRIASSFIGFVLISFLATFLYSFGISPWVLFAVTYPIFQSNLAANIQAVANGAAPTYVAVQETSYALIFIGGTGSTLALSLMLAFLSKSEQLKAIGKAILAPAIFNINEPLIFGAPVAFNPFLMIPLWINGALIPGLAYLIMSAGLVNTPSQTYLLWYLPYPFASYFATQDWRAVIAVFFLFVISWLVYYPFFKAYDNSLLKEEQEQTS